MGQKEGIANAPSFADALDDLKQRGSLLLVVGEDGSAQRTACDRLLGDPVAAPRRRLLIRTDADTAPDGGASSGQGRQIQYRTETRSAATQASVDPDVGASPPAQVVDGSLTDLQDAVEGNLDELLPDGDPEPGEVRICVDDASDLLAAHGEEATFAFLHVLGASIRDVSGMGHVHLPIERDADVVSVLTPVFDAVIEVRSGPEHRWFLRDAGVRTEWLPI